MEARACQNRYAHRSIRHIDELNSFIGWVATYLEEKEYTDLLQAIQSRLFDIGTDWQQPRKTKSDIAGNTKESITQMENYIDKMTTTAGN